MSFLWIFYQRKFAKKNRACIIWISNVLTDYNLFYKILTNDKFIGDSTKKNEMVGIVASGVFQVNMVFGIDY